jgi:hypothetical protein
MAKVNISTYWQKTFPEPDRKVRTFTRKQMLKKISREKYCWNYWQKGYK